MNPEVSNEPNDHTAQPPLRFVTAASLFDGHDAAINIMRRLIQDRGVEVIHLGHNRSVADILNAALQEDADAICISSYQGGHVEFFKFLIDELKHAGADHISVFGGGGGTITLEEINELEAYGVERIYHPTHGMQMGLNGMIDDVVARASKRKIPSERKAEKPYTQGIAQTLSRIENAQDETTLAALRSQWQQKESCAVIGITGTGGAGKSSLTDELLNRFANTYPELQIGILAVDPTRRRTGGALLGDRIRMNALRHPNTFMRSMATRRQHVSTNAMLSDAIGYMKTCGFDLVFVETAGIGQSDSEIVDLVDISTYVMTSEFGAASQLEKIDMIDFADVIVINKFERGGSQDALRDVRKQWRRNHNRFDIADAEVPVYPTIASQFNDRGVNTLFAALCQQLSASQPNRFRLPPNAEMEIGLPIGQHLIGGKRIRYLSDIADNGRQQKQKNEQQAAIAGQLQHYYEVLKDLNDPLLPAVLESYDEHALQEANEFTLIRQKYQSRLQELDIEFVHALKAWPETRQKVLDQHYQYQVRDKVLCGDNYRKSLSGTEIPKVSPPRYNSWEEIILFLGNENLPGYYPYTAGVFPYRRENEDPIRMFAGEGTPERTNRRFHYLSQGQAAARLSTAFDSVTLYGENPDRRPDIYGKVGNSGVSIATLDDMKKLYSGFNLCDPNTSVSMTINGPAPIILAFFMNTAIDQQVELYLKKNNLWDRAKSTIDALRKDKDIAHYVGELPEGHNGLGLDMLGVTGDQLLDADTYEDIKRTTLSAVRGTVQADILKEDQAQNTCIFSTEFALHMMGDIQSFFIENKVQNFYSVSISGYHIAEAGANPISQLAFTLANGFTLVEYYLSRGMAIDDFAPNLSFFFSNGMDPEYSVIGRVARRIWAKAIKHRYAGSERSQKLKYHIQTSGRSLHAQEIQFNDIRTTLQALYALLDSCNSLHTNAYDEAITTPTEESVRRAVAIQLIINRELGINQCENPWQGSFFIEHLTDAVEEAVYLEFERLSERGGVLGAMDTMYQRSKIQDESMYYEHKKHDGSLPIIGVNTFLGPDADKANDAVLELARSTADEKLQQIEQLQGFHHRHANQADDALRALQTVAKARSNTFAALMDVVKHCSLGQVSHALYLAGGEYRRNM